MRRVRGNKEDEERKRKINRWRRERGRENKLEEERKRRRNRRRRERGREIGGGEKEEDK